MRTSTISRLLIAPVVAAAVLVVPGLLAHSTPDTGQPVPTVTAPVELVASTTIRIFADNVNIRRSPSTSGTIIGRARANAVMKADCRTGDFIRGTVAGKKGYVKADVTSAVNEFFSRRAIDTIPPCRGALR